MNSVECVADGLRFACTLYSKFRYGIHPKIGCDSHVRSSTPAAYRTADQHWIYIELVGERIAISCCIFKLYFEFQLKSLKSFTSLD